MILSKITQRLGLAWIIGLGGAVAAIVFLAWLAGEVIEGDTRHFDDWAATKLHSHASPFLTSLMSGITLLGATRVLIGLGAIVVFGFLFANWRRDAVLFLVTMGGAALLNRVLKLSFQRQRPQPYFDIVAPSSYSFPSGHALLSFCFYGVIAIIVAAHLKRQSQRTIVWTVVAVLVLLVGISRIYLGVHYASDVIAGFTAAFIWLVAVNFALHLRRNNSPESRSEG